jgi:Wiskott-Aldrich syndrome protein
MVSAPQTDSFLHVAHIGINEKGIIETSKEIDQPWSALRKELSSLGVTQSMCEENLDFIEGFLAGARSVDKGSISVAAKKNQERQSFLPAGVRSLN